MLLAAFRSPRCAAADAFASFWQSDEATPGLVESVRVSVQSESYVTVTVKLVLPVVELPATSVAVAWNVLVPSAKLEAGPLMSAQVLVASPESPSLALQV